MLEWFAAAWSDLCRIAWMMRLMYVVAGGAIGTIILLAVWIKNLKH